jgi:hypothetical protein
MQKPFWLASSTILLALVFILSGCTKEEITPAAGDMNLQAQMVNSKPISTSTCCTVGGGHQSWCMWRTALESVLNCCHAEPLNSPPCFWAPVAPLETSTFHFGSDITLPATGAYVDSKILEMAAMADANRPGPMYVIIGYEVTNLGTVNGICTLQIVVTYRKKVCYFQ